MALPTPSPTLYVSGLETKTKKPELRAQLYALFTPYGRVIDVVAKKHGGGRGQAFVVFAEQAAATTAMRSLSGESFYSQSLRISYAKAPSNATLARHDPSASKDAAAIAAAKLVVSRAQGEYEQLEKEREKEGKRGLDDDAGDIGRETKRPKGDVDGDDEEMEIEMEDDEDVEKALPKENGSRKAMLVCTNLPPECTDEIMGALFSQHAGFSRSAPLPTSHSVPKSHPPSNPGAKSFLITFESRAQAETALGPTNGFVMQPGWEMSVSLD
ncbi:MAG: hypothetical protein TREMPRED_002889 [Tremellales sp. Tagirdzhanova-0007]|nr:MAG: hypothetical protein TREMPRED_002889 [Tremellales sp. Tagirdzhanova-0007]